MILLQARQHSEDIKMFSRTYGSPIINYLNHNAFHVKCLAAKATAQKVWNKILLYDNNISHKAWIIWFHRNNEGTSTSFKIYARPASSKTANCLKFLDAKILSTVELPLILNCCSNAWQFSVDPIFVILLLQKPET